jgi:peptidyl-prolyl cis-trans isomerase SurA
MKHALTAILLASMLAAPASGVAQTEVIEQVLVKVNGEIFTKSDLEERQISALRQRNPPPQMTDAELQKSLAEVTPQILVDTIDEMLLIQRGRDLGYTLGDEQFNEILTNIKKENKIETDEQFQQALKQEGLTLPELRKSIEKNMIVQRVQSAEVFGRIQVSEAEARTFWEAHRNEFTSPQTLMIREILVAVASDGKTLNVGLDEEAKAKAEGIRSRILAGESFEKLATELSDSSSKANGGLVGPLQPSELDAALRKLFEAMKPGDVSAVTRTSGGYQVFKLESRTEPKVLPFEEARDQIANRVVAEKRRAEFVKYLQKLRAEAIIEWKNAELRKLYEAQLADRG